MTSLWRTLSAVLLTVAGATATAAPFPKFSDYDSLHSLQSFKPVNQKMGKIKTKISLPSVPRLPDGFVPRLPDGFKKIQITPEGIDIVKTLGQGQKQITILSSSSDYDLIVKDFTKTNGTKDYTIGYYKYCIPISGFYDALGKYMKHGFGIADQYVDSKGILHIVWKSDADTVARNVKLLCKKGGKFPRINKRAVVSTYNPSLDENGSTYVNLQKKLQFAMVQLNDLSKRLNNLGNTIALFTQNAAKEIKKGNIKLYTLGFAEVYPDDSWKKMTLDEFKKYYHDKVLFAIEVKNIPQYNPDYIDLNAIDKIVWTYTSSPITVAYGGTAKETSVNRPPFFQTVAAVLANPVQKEVVALKGLDSYRIELDNTSISTVCRNTSGGQYNYTYYSCEKELLSYLAKEIPQKIMKTLVALSRKPESPADFVKFLRPISKEFEFVDNSEVYHKGVAFALTGQPPLKCSGGLEIGDDWYCSGDPTKQTTDYIHYENYDCYKYKTLMNTTACWNTKYKANIIIRDLK
jgi:hypothetical protein